MPSEIVFYINHYGYLAIFILIFLQETGVPNPIPNELVLLFSGYLVYSGVFKFYDVILVAVLADFAGTNILYFVFKAFGNQILKNKPRWIPISQRKIDSLSNARKLNDEGVPFDKVNVLLEDQGGNLWAGCRDGLARLSPKHFTTYTRQQGLTHNTVMSVFTTKPWQPLARHLGGGLNQLGYEGHRLYLRRARTRLAYTLSPPPPAPTAFPNRSCCPSAQAMTVACGSGRILTVG